MICKHAHDSGSAFPPERWPRRCCGKDLEPSFGVGAGCGYGSYDACLVCWAFYNFRPARDESTEEELARWDAYARANGIVGEIVAFAAAAEVPGDG